MGRRGPPQSGQKERDRRGDDVYQDLADNVWRHQQCWVRMGINPKEAGYERHRVGLCASCQQADMHEFAWQIHKESAATLRKWAEALDELVDKTFELVKGALIESRGNAGLEPGELARLCPDRVEAFQHAWKVAKATIEQEDKHRAYQQKDKDSPLLYVPPDDASQFKDLAASFQLWPLWFDRDPRHQEVMERDMAKGLTHLSAVRPVPWLDLNGHTDLLDLAKRAALGAHSARAARERAEWHDKIRLEHFGATENEARDLAIERYKASAVQLAEFRLFGQIPQEERHLRMVFTKQLERYDLSDRELGECLRNEEFLARCILGEASFRFYLQNRHEPAKNLLARILLMPDEFAAYQKDPQAWNLGRVFEEKLQKYRAGQGRWERMIQSAALSLRVGKSRRRRNPRP